MEEVLTKENATLKAYTYIKTSIMEGRLLPGVHLREGSLAQEIGISRTPIRQSLFRLAAEGLVEFAPNRGATVTVWRPEAVKDVFELRIVLEVLGARFAAERIEEAELQVLERINGEIEDLAAKSQRDLQEISRLNRNFHLVIHKAARIERLAQFLTQLIEIPNVLMSFQRYNPEELQRSIRQHKDIISSLRAGDPELSSALMRSHILSGLGSFKRRLADHV